MDRKYTLAEATAIALPVNLISEKSHGSRSAKITTTRRRQKAVEKQENNSGKRTNHRRHYKHSQSNLVLPRK
jgi:hypothetical protein